MFDHVLIRVADRSASEAFYRGVFEPLGVESFEPLAGITRWGNLGVTEADADHPVTQSLHVTIPAGRHKPETRTDPDGNVVELVSGDVGEGVIGRLELRVADLRAARDFYATVAPHTGFALAADEPDHARFRGDSGSLSLVTRGEPTRHLHLAFSAPDEPTVTAFHLTATNAGYADNGAPGERPVYGDGYFGAFVLDPDGNNVEVVHTG